MTIVRIFDAPRSRVFKAWIDATHVAQWWGPKDFTTPVCEVDARPGGNLRFEMHGPEGTIYPGHGIYREVVEPERLVFTTTSDDEQGNAIFEILNTVTFADENGKTKLTLEAVVIKSDSRATESLDGMHEGWSQSLDRLEKLVAKV